MHLMTRSREWLLFNAVEAWLVNYGNQPTETVAQYKQLRDVLHDAYMQSLNKDADTPAPKSSRKRTTNVSQSSAKTV